MSTDTLRHLTNYYYYLLCLFVYALFVYNSCVYACLFCVFFEFFGLFSFVACSFSTLILLVRSFDL